MQRLSIARSDAPRRPTQSGAACDADGCRGRISVYTTRVNAQAGLRTRYLACDVCGHKPETNKQIVPLEYAPPRPK